jgi:hypothetical protein
MKRARWLETYNARGRGGVVKLKKGEMLEGGYRSERGAKEEKSEFEKVRDFVIRRAFMDRKILCLDKETNVPKLENWE